MKKKIVFFLAMASCILPATQAQAQELVERVKSKLYYGPKIEANLSSYMLSDMPSAESEMKFGAAIGGFIGYRISNNFSIHEDILLNYKTSDISNESITHYKSLGAELTFYAMGNFSAGSNGKILLGAGPFVSYGISSKAKTNDIEIDMFKKYDGNESAFSRLNVGAAIIAGYELKCGLQITATYRLGLINQLNANKNNAALRPSALSLGIGYRLGK